MNLRDLDIEYDRDLIKRVSFLKGQSVRPLWSVIESQPRDLMISWVDRMDSLCPFACEWALAQAIEEACGVILPQRSQYVRTIFAEINRLVYLTTFLGNLLKAASVPLVYQKMMILREAVFQKQEELMGGRVLPQVLKVGGARRELAIGDVQKVAQFIQVWRSSWNEAQDLLKDDYILFSRLEGLLKISQNEIRKKGLWGIIGKGAGVVYDSRIHQPHGAYAHIELNLNYNSNLNSDALSRYLVATKEVEIALGAIDSLVKKIPNDVPTEKSNATLQPGIYSASAESGKGPVTAVIEVDGSGVIRTVRLFNVAQRIWPQIENYFRGIKSEDFNLAWASLGMSGEDAEI